MQTKLNVPGISCDHCARTIQLELSRVEGVISVEVDVPAKTVSLELEDDASLTRAKAMLDEIEYPVAKG